MAEPKKPDRQCLDCKKELVFVRHSDNPGYNYKTDYYKCPDCDWPLEMYTDKDGV